MREVQNGEAAFEAGGTGSSLFSSPVTTALCRFSSRPAFRSTAGDTVRQSTVPQAMKRLRQNFNDASIRVFLDLLTVPLPRQDADSLKDAFIGRPRRGTAASDGSEARRCEVEGGPREQLESKATLSHTYLKRLDWSVGCVFDKVDTLKRVLG